MQFTFVKRLETVEKEPKLKHLLSHIVLITPTVCGRGRHTGGGSVCYWAAKWL